MRIKSLLGVVCCLASAGSCLAATVQPIQGTLYVGHGQGWQPTTVPVEANVGDTVMVAPGGVATIVYPDGCRFGVQPGTVATITSSSPCVNQFAPTDAVALDNTPNNYALEFGGAALLGAAGLGTGLYAMSQKKSTTTVFASPCGSTISNPCFVSP